MPTKSTMKRAKVACSNCHRRKIRCDLTVHGNPCTNCRLDDTTCLVTSREKCGPRRKRGATILGTAPSEVQPADIVLKGSFDGQLPGEQEEIQESILNTPRSSLLIPNNLPSYIKRPSTMLDIIDLQYLQGTDALNVPTGILRDELLKSYIRFVHPHMPIVDLANFVQAVKGSESICASDQLSLLLFQAVMFAGSLFIDLKYLLAAGYCSRKVARDHFFHRAQSLYRMQYESKATAVVQSLLLMLSQYEVSESWEQATVSIGICYSLAIKLGLHREDSKLSASHTSSYHFLRRRLWWSLVMQDTIVSLQTGLPPIICSNTYNVRLPQLGDFKFDIFSTQSEYFTILDAAQRREMALIFIEKVKLCQALNEEQTVWLTSPVNTTHMPHLQPTADSYNSADLYNNVRRLEMWRKGQARETVYKSLTASGRVQSPWEIVVACHRATLHLMHFLSLCQAYGLPKIRNLHHNLSPTTRYYQTLNDGAGTLISILIELYRLDSLNRLPYLLLNAVFNAGFSRLGSLWNTTSLDDRLRSFRDINVCLRIFRSLQDDYDGVDHLRCLLDSLTQKSVALASFPAWNGEEVISAIANQGTF
ncbi:fungal-specific transcription factor domain-containing protein [Aspergillus pseudodeflectus]|uniref:Fungal-specific transcription factor domain-containing protein n=1 Tax=Aspergillus pseudodeflectus TaxID=176178 RepID=A0ABR4JCQ0_9EURO